jgi:hypothetical protein
MTLGAFETATGTMTLNSAGKIIENSSTGNISAATLTGSSVGGASFTLVNVPTLAAFTNTGSGDFYIGDTAGTLTVTGAVSTASGGTLSVVNFGSLVLSATSSLSAPGAAGTVSLGKSGAGSITQAGGSVITAGALQGVANGGISLDGANRVMVLGSISNDTSGSFSFTNNQALATTGTLSSVGTLTLTTTGGTGSTLTLGGNLTATGSTVTLSATGAIGQTSGFITAATLTGSSVGGATLTGANRVTSLGAFSDTGAGNATGFSFTDAQALGTAGTVQSSGQITLKTTGGTGSALTLGGNLTATGNTVTLTTSGAIGQAGGIITAGMLTGTAVGSVSLDKNNAVGTFNFSNSLVSGDVSFTDAVPLTVSGGFSNQDLTITTTSGAGITLTGTLHASANLTLDSAGTIAETGAGLVQSGGGFSGSSVGGATLTGNNAVISFQNFTNTVSGDIDFTNTAVNASVSGLASFGDLTVAGAGILVAGDLTVGSGGTLTLTSTGAISQSGGVITAATLTGSSVGGTTLNGANLVTSLGAFSDTGAGNATGFSLTDAQALSITGTLQSTGQIKLTTTGGTASTLTLGGNMTAAGNTVTLTATGAIDQTAGIITAATLTGSSVGGATLTRANRVAALGAFTDTGAGNVTGFNFTDAQALSTTGAVQTSGGIALTTTGGTSSSLTLGGNLTATGNTVTLTATGAIDQTAGVITAATLTGGSVGGATLDGANRVAALGAFTDSGAGNATGFSFTDAQALTTTGTVRSTGQIGLTTTGGTGSTLTLGGSLTATGNTVTLTAAGAIGQAGGVITAATLTGSSVGGATLTRANRVAALGAFSDTGAGNATGFGFTDAQALSTTGTVQSTGQITLATTGGTGSTLTLGGNLTASGSTVTLSASGTIDQAAGVITAGTLTGSSVGGATLTGANLVAALGAFSDTGAGNATGFSFTDAQALSTNGTVRSTGQITLTTTGGTGSTLTLGGNVTTAGDTVTLKATGAIDQAAGVITAATLTGSSAGGATLTGANLVATLGAFSDTGAANATGFNFTDARTLTTAGAVSSTGSLTLTTSAGRLVLGDDVTASRGIVTLNSAGTISQSGGAIDPGALLINAGGAVSLLGANTVDSLAANITGAGASLKFNDTANDLTIGTVGGVSGVTTNNAAVTLRTTTSGDIILAQAVDAGAGTVKVAASGDLRIGAAGSVTAGAGATLATLGNFTNAAGAGAISVGASSRWLIYSTDPGADRDGGLTPDFIQYGAAYNIGMLRGTAPAGTGDGFLYSLTPTLTLTGVTKTYDGTRALPGGAGFTFSGGLAGDTITLGGTPTGSFAGKDAGNGIAVTVRNLTVAASHGGIAVFGYKIAPVTDVAIGTIGKATLTVSLSGPVEKTYDGNIAATLTGGNYTLNGLIGGDRIIVHAASGVYGGEDAGTGIAVTATGLTLTGADAGNYILAKTSATADIGTIDPKTITAGLTGTVRKTYDGTTAATLNGGNYTLTGLIAGDMVGLNDPSSGKYASAGPGSGIAVTVNGLALDGADAGNYRLATRTVTADVGVITAETMPPPPPPPPPPPGIPSRPSTPFIPVVPPQPAQSVAHIDARSLAVPTLELADRIKLSGCSGGDFVAVVPAEDGHVGTVVVESEGNKTVLHAAYAGCSGSRPVITSPQALNRQFGGALAARPTPPVAFELYYRTGSVTLAPDALAVFDKAFAEIGRRSAVDVVVAGFTDTVGTPRGNDLLSLARAQMVTRLLIERGLKRDSIMTVGRGERDPQIPTAPQVAEDKNRRVEITVR